jgi:hypothetical protein
MPPFSQEALRILRDPSMFRWEAIIFLGLAIYVYAVEIEKRNWNTVFAGLAFWSVDWINEIINALVLHFTGYAAIWTTTGQTSFQIMVGLTYEIAVLFSVSGIIFVKTLPKDPALKVVGIPNRWLAVVGFSCFSVFVEVLLNRTGSFHWAYPWWNVPHVWLIIIFGYGTFFAAAAWVHDMPLVKSKVKAVGVLGGVAAAGLILFGPVLGWI